MEDKIVKVVAALIWERANEGDKINKDNRFMICQRPKEKKRGLLWEFVGGKVEEGETKEEALIRECREELNITVCPHGVFMTVIHTYPDIKIELTLFNATIEKGIPKALEHNDIKWITPFEVGLYDFCPADDEILKRINLLTGYKPLKGVDNLET